MSHQSKKRKMPAFTPRQRAILLTGDSQGFTGRGFVNEMEALCAWTRHRRELLDQTGNRLPAAYFQFELCEETPPWIVGTEALLRSGELRGEEHAKEIETNPMLSDRQPEELNSVFLTMDGIRELGYTVPDLERLLRESGIAQAWHAYRKRPALAAKYERIGTNIRAILRELLIGITLEEDQHYNSRTRTTMART
jgi:hypothetical protein